MCVVQIPNPSDACLFPYSQVWTKHESNPCHKPGLCTVTVIWIEAAGSVGSVGKARSGWSAPGGSEWACWGWECQWDVIEWDVLRVRQEGQMRGRCVEVQELPMWSPPPQPSPSVSRAVIPLHVSPLAPTGASIVSLWVGRSHRPGFAVFALASHTQLSPWQSHTHKHTLMAHLWVAGWGVRWNSVRQDFEFEEIEDYAFTDLWLM